MPTSRFVVVSAPLEERVAASVATRMHGAVASALRLKREVNATLQREDLNDKATHPRFVYVHQWQLHDLVMWDNRQTMHRVRRFPDTTEARDMRRTTLTSGVQTALQEDQAEASVAAE